MSQKKLVKRVNSSKNQYPPASHPKNDNQKIKDNSLVVLEELVQCSVCLEKLKDPRILPCQHSFCFVCLKSLVTAKNLVKVGAQLEMSQNIKAMSCPVCKKEVPLTNGIDSLAELPKNLQAEAILKLLNGETANSSSRNDDFRCVKCQTVSERQKGEHICQHCLQIFCSICWMEHLSELDSNLNMLIKQMEEARSRLEHKGQNFAGRCDQVIDTIKQNIKEKIEKIKQSEERVLLEMDSIKRESNVLRDIIYTRMDELKNKIEVAIKDDKQSKHKISNYMNVHRETAKLFEEIYQYGDARIVFDSDKIKIDQDKEGIYQDINDKDNAVEESVENPFKDVASMVKHYKSRSFVPKLLWSKCPRPEGVNIPPWDPTKIYVAATDTKNILVIDKQKFKLIKKINNPEMLCPTNIAFSKKYEEMFVTDRWKNCVHVFSSDGEYLTNFNEFGLKRPDGIAVGPDDEIIVCDTGNNRILAINSESGEVLYSIGNGKLHIPTSVAVHGDKLIIADTGNNRVKIFNREGDLLQEIGAFGRNKGEFRSAEVVAVDCFGFILVGDAGNARIQVFQPDGKFVRIFGGTEGFEWISGIYVTPELDIICTDKRKRTLRIF
ncbi:unnamed protein product [Phyllotreta striolata]|uniref:RING-type domain-containing protein n=1 Tax=Phyllotreta striolata TaxID=444603 RepID=A0A9N9XJD3_PHYSR|nr:unnamed protein product [Phyllotreta striolata]